jgi:hypothetical protein
MSAWGHPSIPFLTAAIAALFLYRGMISLAGFVAAAWLTAHLVGTLRKE